MKKKIILSVVFGVALLIMLHFVVYFIKDAKSVNDVINFSSDLLSNEEMNNYKAYFTKSCINIGFCVFVFLSNVLAFYLVWKDKLSPKNR